MNACMITLFLCVINVFHKFRGKSLKAIRTELCGNAMIMVNIKGLISYR